MPILRLLLPILFGFSVCASDISDSTSTDVMQSEYKISKNDLPEILQFLYSEVPPLVALEWGAYHNSKLSIEYALERGGSIFHCDHEGKSLVLMAVWNGHREMVEWLVNEKGLSVHGAYPLINTSLHLAAFKGDQEMMELLCQKNIDINITTGRNNVTPLHTAVSIASVKAVEWLLLNKANPTASTREGMTALDIVEDRQIVFTRSQELFECDKLKIIQLLNSVNDKPNGPSVDATYMD